MVNDVFGFEAWLGNMASRYEIIVKRDVELISINKTMLADMSKSHSALLRYIIRKLAEQFSTQTQRLIEADSLSISGRICAELKRQSKTLDLNSNSAIIQPIPVFSDFALKVGSSRESVSRTINELCKSGVIIRKPGALIIASEDDLLARIR